MKNKKEICVPIRDEKELQQAREILERNGEKIDGDVFYMTNDLNFDYLKYSLEFNEWYLGCGFRTEIPLSELESVLRGESESENAYYSFFKFMSDEHNLILTDTEMSDIINEAKKVIEKLKND